MENFQTIYIFTPNERISAEREFILDDENTNQLGANWRNQRQSTNVVDLRVQKAGMRRVTVVGYLTWNTFFHLASNTANNIAISLLNRGFDVSDLSTSFRDKRNSQYYFRIYLWVWNQYSLQFVSRSVRNALLDVAYGDSIRITNIYNADVY